MRAPLEPEETGSPTGAVALARDICYDKASILKKVRPAASPSQKVEREARCLALPPILTWTGGPEMKRLGQLFHWAAGLLRWEPDYAYRAHRAFPSPRALYATVPFLITPGIPALDEGTYRYNATQHALERMPARASWRQASVALSAELPPDMQLIVLSCEFDRITPHYGDFAYALGPLEVGHAAESFVSTASVLGYGVSVHSLFVDDIFRGLLTADVPAASPFMVLMLHGQSPAGRWARVESLADSLRVVSPARVVNAPRITEVERSAREGLRPRTPRSFDASGEPADAQCVPSSVQRALRLRNSGWGGPHGELNPHPISVPRTVLDKGLFSVGREVVHDVDWQPAFVRHLVAIRCEGLDPGVYRVDEEAQALMPHSLGDARPALRDAYIYPPEQGNLHALAGVIIYSANFDEALRHWGPRGLRMLHMFCGAAAQRVCVALSFDLFFGRPVRAFKDEALESLTGIRYTPLSSCYAVLLGASRHPVPSYDLSRRS